MLRILLSLLELEFHTIMYVRIANHLHLLSISDCNWSYNRHNSRWKSVWQRFVYIRRSVVADNWVTGQAIWRQLVFAASISIGNFESCCQVCRNVSLKIRILVTSKQWRVIQLIQIFDILHWNVEFIVHLRNQRPL